ncbi:hypothetical protein U1Q18_009865, partial [Sarracenia purpurea var. burkii]
MPKTQRTQGVQSSTGYIRLEFRKPNLFLQSTGERRGSILSLQEIGVSEANASDPYPKLAKQEQVNLIKGDLEVVNAEIEETEANEEDEVFVEAPMAMEECSETKTELYGNKCVKLNMAMEVGSSRFLRKIARLWVKCLMLKGRNKLKHLKIKGMMRARAANAQNQSQDSRLGGSNPDLQSEGIVVVSEAIKRGTVESGLLDKNQSRVANKIIELPLAQSVELGSGKGVEAVESGPDVVASEEETESEYENTEASCEDQASIDDEANDAEEENPVAAVTGKRSVSINAETSQTQPFLEAKVASEVEGKVSGTEDIEVGVISGEVIKPEKESRAEDVGFSEVLVESPHPVLAAKTREVMGLSLLPGDGSVGPSVNDKGRGNFVVNSEAKKLHLMLQGQQCVHSQGAALAPAAFEPNRGRIQRLKEINRSKMFPASPKAGSEETTSEVPVSVSVDVDLEVENNLEAEGDFCATQGDCEDCRIKSRIEVDKGKGEDEDMISNSGRLFSRDSKDNGDSRESNNLDVADFGVMVPVKAGKQGNLTLATPKLKPQVTLVSDCAITGENAVGLTPKRREDEEKQAVVFKQESEDAHKVFEKKPHPSSDAQNHLFVEQKLAPGYGMDFPQLSMEAKENTVDPMRQDARNRTWAKIVALNNGEATASEAQGTFCLEQRRP